jgi:TonB family protein
MTIKLLFILVIIINIFCPLLAQNQRDTVYLNALGDKVIPNLASRYLVKSKSSKTNTETHEEYDAISGRKSSFYILKKLPQITLDEMVVTGYVVENGQPISSYKKPFITTYLDSAMLKQSNYMEWYPSGSLKIKATYVQGRLNGNLETYHPNGKPKQIEVYHLDTLTTGHSFDSLGIAITHVPYFELPRFPKGQLAMYRFLAQLIKYPKNARESGTQETIFVSFTIDIKGKITNIRTINSQSTDLVTASIQTVKAMPKWAPAKLDGQNIAVTYVLPIKYILE